MRKFSPALFAAAVLSLALLASTNVNAAPKAAAPKIVVSKCDAKTLRAEGWQIPRPPYPFAARAHREQGSMDVEIVTGANGQVVRASVPKSKDHPNLDLATARWAYAHWSGPPHHRMSVPVTYMIR